MMISDKKSALEFIRAWANATATRQSRVFRLAAESQRTCAVLSRSEGMRKAHLAAASVLDRAVSRAVAS